MPRELVDTLPFAPPFEACDCCVTICATYEGKPGSAAEAAPSAALLPVEPSGLMLALERCDCAWESAYESTLGAYGSLWRAPECVGCP